MRKAEGKAHTAKAISAPKGGYKKAHARMKSGMGGCWAVVGVAVARK